MRFSTPSRAPEPTPVRSLLSLVHSMVVGGDAIDDADVLRTGATAQVLGHRVMAPSTLGTFLRSFTFGHVRQLDRLAEAALARAWAAGAGPGEGPMTIDLDSTICEVHGHQKGGAGYGYTRVLGYHPLLATRADTGELLHTRLRTGRAHSARGAVRFWSAKIIAALRQHRIRFSITVRQTGPVKRTIAAIPEGAWVPIDYPAPGIAQVAETHHEGERLIVRRVRHEADQGELVLDWRHHAFVSDRDGDARELDRDHRAHAVVEPAIRDLKEGSGLAHCPSGRFFANAAWLVLAGLAHNLLRRVAAPGLRIPGAIVAKTVRRRYLTLPGRITRSGRRRRVHLPRDWSGADTRDALRAQPRRGERGDRRCSMAPSPRHVWSSTWHGRRPGHPAGRPSRSPLPPSRGTAPREGAGRRGGPPSGRPRRR